MAYSIPTGWDNFKPSAPPAGLYPDLSSYSTFPPVNPNYIPYVTEAVHQKTLQLLSYAKGLSNALADRQVRRETPLCPKRESPFISVGKIDLSDRSWRMFNQGDTYIAPREQMPREQKKEKDEQAQRVFVGIVGVVAFFSTLFFLGKKAAEKEEMQEESLNFEELKKNWVQHEELYDPTYRKVVNRIASKVEKILYRKHQQRVQATALLVLGCAAGGAAFTGALMGAQALMTAGMVMGVAAGAGALYRLGYNYWSQRDQKDAASLNQDLAQIQQLPSPLVS